MKTFITRFLVVGGMAIAVLASCKKDEIRTVAPTAATGVGLTLSTTTPTLSKAALTTNAITVTAASANYNFNAATIYTLQFAVKGTNFATPTEVSLTKDALAKTYTVKEFNDVLLAMKLSPGVSAQIEVRLKTALSATAGVTYSSVSTITATPFALVSYIYVPGAYQGWNPATADSLRSELGNGVYTGIINYTSGNLEFKITPQKKWDVAYGTSGTGTISTSGGNIAAPAAGQYYLRVDLNANTFSMVKADYFSVIGSSAPGTAWSTDTDLKYNNGTLAWEGTMAMTVGEFKLRMNHDWGTSFGVPKTGADGATLNNNDNNNIPIATAGNYKVTFTPVYSSDITKLGTIDKSATAKYSVTKL